MHPVITGAAGRLYSFVTHGRSRMTVVYVDFSHLYNAGKEQRRSRFDFCFLDQRGRQRLRQARNEREVFGELHGRVSRTILYSKSRL